MMQLKTTGEMQEFETGAHRDSQAGKGRFDLIPPEALRAVAIRFEQGAIVYGERNWEKGMPVGRFLDSAMRHICDYESGDRSEDHLAAAAWNILCAHETDRRIKHGDLPAALGHEQNQRQHS